MFAIQCTTCGARLAVKSETLIGQILPCPKCGGMVLVQRPEEKPSALDRALQQSQDDPTPPFTTFPAPSMLETESGIIKPDLLELRQRQAAQGQSPEPGELADSEIKTRKILLGILAGFVALLLLLLGLLIVFKFSAREAPEHNNPDTTIAVTDKPQEPPLTPPQSPPQTPSAVVEAAPNLAVAPMVESTVKSVVDTVVEPEAHGNTNEKRDQLASLLTQNPEKMPDDTPTDTSNSETKTAPSEIRKTTDVVSTLERKMPALFNASDMRTIDIPAKLALPLAGVKLEKVPLLTFVRTLESLTEIPFTLDVDGFRGRGISLDTPLTGNAETGTVGEILTALLRPLQLEPVLEDRQLLVTISKDVPDEISEQIFDVSDLVTATNDGKKLTPKFLADTLRKLIDPIGFAGPDSAQPSLRVEGQTLVIRHRLRMRDASLRLLEQLRMIRNTPPTTARSGAALAPEAFGWDAVLKPMTLNYYQPTPLAGILKQMEEKTGLHIVVDHRALHRALSPLESMRATVRCDQGTVNSALENLLSSIDVTMLTYRIVDANVLEVTTALEARKPEKMSVEIHPYATAEKPLPDGETPEDLVRALCAALEPDSWYDATNRDTWGLGDIVIDHASGCLIVRQSQPIQRQIRLWLGRKLSGDEPPPSEL